MKQLADGLGLITRRTEEPLVTFPMLGERLDWILVSPELEIIEQRVLPTAVSDHLAVVADVRVRTP